MKNCNQIIYLVILILLLAFSAYSEVPQVINYQGQTSVDCGVDNLCAVTAVIYAEVSGGSVLWAEVFTNVPISDQGVFNILLGSGSPGYPDPDFATLFTGDQRWLEITVESFTFSPRVALASMPYSFRQETVDGASGGVISSNIQVQGTIKTGDNQGNAGLIEIYDGSLVVMSIDGVTESGSQILLNNEQGTQTIQLDGDATPTGGGYIGIYNNEGNLTANLRGDDEDADGLAAAKFKMFSSNGMYETVIIAGREYSSSTSEVQGGAIYLYSDNGERRVKIDSEELNQAGSITLYDKDEIAEIVLDAERGLGNPGRIITPVIEITGGSDLSEQFDVSSGNSDQNPIPGMVVSINPDIPGNLMISNKAYDPAVAGIISGAGDVIPGMLMGQLGSIANGQYPIALTGRVYCLVDASYGVVKPGDLLTTSDTPGHAMKVTDRNRSYGTVIGKAMTSLDEGQGLVLVLVGLQ